MQKSLHEVCGFNTEFDLLVELRRHIGWMFEDAHEIGTSDVNCAIHGFFKLYDVDSSNHAEVSPDEWKFFKTLVHRFWI